jgi:hypothetical protein
MKTLKKLTRCYPDIRLSFNSWIEFVLSRMHHKGSGTNICLLRWHLRKLSTSVDVEKVEHTILRYIKVKSAVCHILQSLRCLERSLKIMERYFSHFLITRKFFFMKLSIICDERMDAARSSRKFNFFHLPIPRSKLYLGEETSVCIAKWKRIPDINLKSYPPRSHSHLLIYNSKGFSLSVIIFSED